MARKTQISREVILEAAMQLLLRDGYSSINITALAKEIGCSTQPIAWHFGNMEGLRTALLEHCLDFLRDIFKVEGENAAEILEHIAVGYIDLAFDYPNLYKYFYMSDHEGRKMNELTLSLRAEVYGRVMKMLAQEYGVSMEAAEHHMVNLQVYVHGIASYTVSQMSFSSKEVIMQMIHSANEAFFMQLKLQVQNLDKPVNGTF